MGSRTISPETLLPAGSPPSGPGLHRTGATLAVNKKPSLALCLQPPDGCSCFCEDFTLVLNLPSSSTKELIDKSFEKILKGCFLSVWLIFSPLVAFFFLSPVRSKLNLSPWYYNWTGRYGPNCINAVPIAAHMFTVPSGATCAAGVIERAGLRCRRLKPLRTLKNRPWSPTAAGITSLDGGRGEEVRVKGGLIVVRQVVELSCLPPCDVIRSPEPESRCHGARTIKAVPNVIASPRLN